MTACAYCGKVIKPNDERYRCKDNHMLFTYFDNDDCNMFCSQECFCDSLNLVCYSDEDEEKEDGW